MVSEFTQANLIRLFEIRRTGPLFSDFVQIYNAQNFLWMHSSELNRVDDYFWNSSTPLQTQAASIRERGLFSVKDRILSTSNYLDFTDVYSSCSYSAAGR